MYTVSENFWLLSAWNFIQIHSFLLHDVGGGISFFMGHRVFKLFVMVLWYAGQYLIVQAFALCWIGLL